MLSGKGMMVCLRQWAEAAVDAAERVFVKRRTSKDPPPLTPPNESSRRASITTRCACP